MNIGHIIGALIVEEIAKEVWRRGTDGKKPKGSMYPLILPEESKNKQNQPSQPSKPLPGVINVFHEVERPSLNLADIQRMTTQYLSSPAAQDWANKNAHILNRSYVERPGQGYNMAFDQALKTIKTMARDHILRELGLV